MSIEMEHDGLLVVKLSTAVCEINLRAPVNDLLELRRVQDADWATRGSLLVGESAGKPVFWAIAEEGAILMIGDDDETWDIALTVPSGAIQDIVRQAQTTR